VEDAGNLASEQARELALLEAAVGALAEDPVGGKRAQDASHRVGLGPDHGRDVLGRARPASEQIGNAEHGDGVERRGHPGAANEHPELLRGLEGHRKSPVAQLTD
jgi:hypothetical protein